MKEAMKEKEVLLEIKHLSKKYGDIVPLRDVSCTIRNGEVISVIGPSGTGKSTFLRCINRLETPDSGEVIFSGNPMSGDKKRLREARRKIGMVFQSFNLFSNMTVLENLTVGPVTLNGLSGEEANAKAQSMLETVGLAGRGDYYPDELSGGQKQRVAIARTLCMDPELLLLDEPTSALDPGMIDEVNSVIRDLASRGYTMLIVTHEMRFAENVSNRIFFMSDGIIYEEGTPDKIFHHPEKEKTRVFIKRLKTHETLFEHPQIDYAKTIADLAVFCHKQSMSIRTANLVTQVFEEAVFELLQTREEAFPVRFEVECGEAGKNCAVFVYYKGDAYDPLKDEDLLPVRILKGTTEKAEHTFENGENRMVFLLP
ncbi:MAG: amino acid ABC transporter ATP-binding protein [Eubacteriales bacterium]|nr:amino acid ABC transporter ATP-binding protein [Eubacteriales bacterium]